MNKNFVLTEREKAIWPPKKEIDGYQYSEAGFWFLMACVVLATIVHFTIEPQIMHKGQTPIVKQEVSYESDQQLCDSATHGGHVSGANPSQLEMYCMVHGSNTRTN